MKNTLFLFLSVLIFISCEVGETPEETGEILGNAEVGYLSLNFELDIDNFPSNGRVAEEVSIQDFTISIVNTTTNDSTRYGKNYGGVPDSIPLSVGSYSIYAYTDNLYEHTPYSHDPYATFDGPDYVTQTDTFMVSAGQVSTVDFQPEMVHSIVSFDYSAQVLTDYDSSYAVVRINGFDFYPRKLEYFTWNTSKGYFHNADSLMVDIYLKKEINGEFVTTHLDGVIRNVQTQTHYKVNVDLDSGAQYGFLSLDQIYYVPVDTVGVVLD